MAFAIILLIAAYGISAYNIMMKLIAAGAYSHDGYKGWKLFCRPVSFIFERLPRK